MLQKAGGDTLEVTAQTVAAMKNTMAILKKQKDNKLAEQQIHAGLASQINAMSAEQRKMFAPEKAAIEAQIPLYETAWFRYFTAYDPRPTLAKVKAPFLALDGDNDLQVAPKINLDLIAAARRAGGNKDYTIKSFPKLNHLFQTSETGLPNEYEKIEETISPQVMETISDWILKRTVVRK